MRSLPKHYRYKYELTCPWGHIKHYYLLIGRRGGLHFHVTDYGENFAERHMHERYTAGLEVHYRQPPEYKRNDPPDHDECWLLKCPCWHDGTSLYAQETLLPVFDGTDHETMFRVLARDADERFEEFGA